MRRRFEAGVVVVGSSGSCAVFGFVFSAKGTDYFICPTVLRKCV
jgi:hypothetical protein